MKKTIIITLVLAFAVLNTFGQTMKVKTSVFFQTDKYELLQNESENLDTLLNFLADKDILNIIVEGNTDNDADSLYNLELSKKRALVVQNYLTDKYFDSNLFIINYYGEAHPVSLNVTDEGKQKNRRVDVVVTYREFEIINEEQNLITDIVVNDSCSRDTTIYLPDGVHYLINICDYIKYKDCIKVDVFIKAECILASGYSTLSSKKEQLVTGGMFNIQLCNKDPLIHPLVIRVPTSGIDDCPDKDYKKMTIWKSGAKNTWTGSEKITLKKGNQGYYYEFNGVKTGVYNLDYVMKEKNLFNIKTEIKSKGKIRILKVSYIPTFPKSVFEQKADKRGKKVKIVLPTCLTTRCEGSTIIKAVGINPRSPHDTLYAIVKLNDLDKRILFGKCKLKKWKYILGFIPVRKTVIYRKYIIQPYYWMNKYELAKFCSLKCQDKKGKYKHR